MTLVYAAKLGLTTQKTNVNSQKIVSSFLKIYGIALARFLL